LIEGYYGKVFRLTSVASVFSGEVITNKLIKELNPALIDIAKLKEDLDEIGYSYSNLIINWTS